jgi:predicted transcriptional regulator
MSSTIIEPRQLKKIRTQLGYTQAALAKAAGVSQSIIAKVEAGDVDPTFSTLSAISRALRETTTKAGKKAADVMSSPVVGVQEGDKIRRCAELMKKRGFSQLPVFSGERIVGTITDSHIVTLLSEAQDPSKPLDDKVGDHVLPIFAVVGRDTPVEALFSLFRYLPVVLVETGNKVEGIITKIDLLSSGA